MRYFKSLDELCGILKPKIKVDLNKKYTSTPHKQKKEDIATQQ